MSTAAKNARAAEQAAADLLQVEFDTPRTVAQLGESYKAAKVLQTYTGTEAEMDAADDRAFEAEEAFKRGLMCLGFSATDAKNMVWGLA